MLIAKPLYFIYYVYYYYYDHYYYYCYVVAPTATAIPIAAAVNVIINLYYLIHHVISDLLISLFTSDK